MRGLPEGVADEISNSAADRDENDGEKNVHFEIPILEFEVSHAARPARFANPVQLTQHFQQSGKAIFGVRRKVLLGFGP